MNRTKDFIHRLTFRSVVTRMITGTIIGLAVISLFVFSVNDPDPDWGNNWRIRPLIVTPLVAAFGFLSFYLKEYIHPKSDWGKITVFLISAVAFVVALWLGTVLGLDGTLWN